MESLRQLSDKYTKPDDYNPDYGTAGYRADSYLLESTLFRCGILMSLKSLHEGYPCGIMITASHNPINDNGVKLIDYTGEMINDKWEKYADLLTKSVTTDELIANIDMIMKENPPLLTTSYVIVGYDTRPSRYMLSNACKDGIKACGVECIDIGQVTTPELQFYVSSSFHNNLTFNKKTDSYILHLVSCFRDLKILNKKTHLHVDCANGIGAKKLQILQPFLEQKGLILHLHNTNGILNHLCGADYIDKYHDFPCNMENINEDERCCSIDGDADRIIYFTKQNGKFKILNGDSITILFALYIENVCRQISDRNQKKINPSIGIVQTNYSNGAATSYINANLPSIKTCKTKTGVKYLHKEAKQFDIGIYFEANGHGTILFDKNFLDKIIDDVNDNINKFKLFTISKLISQVTGDAIANMLLIEIIISTYMNFENWTNLYTDLPSKQVKFIKDKSLFETDYTEQKCIKPISLQEKLDNIMSVYPNSRCFIRPSGTENAIRLYVEGQTIQDVSEIVFEISSEMDKI